MNYLAHFHLAGCSPTMQVGALLGDFVKGPLKGDFSPAIENGIALHRRIDGICQLDEGLKLANNKIPASHRRYAGILIDMMFDHFLTRYWHQFHQQPLQDFANTVYRALEQHQTILPPAAERFTRRLVDHNLLCQYAHWHTLDGVVTSIGNRLKRDNPLQQGMLAIRDDLGELEDDFLDFYPRVLKLTENARD